MSESRLASGDGSADEVVDTGAPLPGDPAEPGDATGGTQLLDGGLLEDLSDVPSAVDATAAAAAAATATASSTPSAGGRLAQLGRQSLVYGLGSIVTRVAGLILLPLYTHYLAPVEYGRVDLVMTGIAAATIVTQLGLVAAFFRFWFDDDADEARRRIFRTTLHALLVSGLVGTLLAVVFARPIAAGLLGDTSHQSVQLVQIGALGVFVQTVYAQFAALFRVQQRPIAFSLATLLNLLVTVSLTVTLVVGVGMRARGMLLGNYLGSIVILVGLVIVQRRWVFGTTSGEGSTFALLKRLLDFGIPMVPAAAALWAVTLINRPILSAIEGAAAVGLLAIGMKLSQAVSLMVQAFQLSWPAFAHSIRDDEEARRTYANVLSAYVVVMGMAVLAIGLLAPWLVAWLTQPRYAGAVPTVLPLTAGAALYGGFFIASIGTARAKKTRSNWVVSLIAAGVELGLLELLVPRYGVAGAAWSVFAAYLVMFALMLRQSHRHFPVSWHWVRLGGASAAVVVLATIAGLLVPDHGLAPLAVRLGLLAVFLPMLVVVRAVRVAELRAIVRRLARGRARALQTTAT